MSKFNTSSVRPATGTGPIVTDANPSGLTFEGAPGYARDAKSELFLLAVANMVGEDTFYEDAKQRDSRYVTLVAECATIDPLWTALMLSWLRGDANMRSAAVVGAAEYVHARLAINAGQPLPRQASAVDEHSITTNRRVIDSVLQRADEPGEMLAYWTSKYGRTIPKPVKRGVADAVRRLYNERNLLKYDTASHGFRFGDVIDLVHPSPDPDKPWQGGLFKYAIDRRHGREWENGLLAAGLVMIAKNKALRTTVAEDRAGQYLLYMPQMLADAGMTWEDALSLAGSKADKAKLWEAMIPSMGYMSLLRNLRNFDEAGVSDEAAAKVVAKLADPAEVARSRQFPMRFLSAYRAAPSLRWAYPLEQAVGHSLANIAEVPGATLILVDTSGSMNAGFSKDGALRRWDAAVLFGVALAQRCAAATVVSFSTDTRAFPLVPGESLLKSLERWRTGGWFLNGGTDTASAVREHYARQERVVILTDEQAAYGGRGDVTATVPGTVAVYTWNLAGYRLGHAAGAANRHTFGGLTDAAFRMIPLMESGRNGDWPWAMA